MNLAGVDTGDIVKVDKKGRRFFAMVVVRDEQGLKIMPFEPRRDTWRTCTAREVIGIWRASKATIVTALEAAEVAGGS